MATHPLPALMNQGVPVVLASDDPAMFSSMGLSFDFYQVGWSLGLVLDSITWTGVGGIRSDGSDYARTACARQYHGTAYG